MRRRISLDPLAEESWKKMMDCLEDDKDLRI